MVTSIESVLRAAGVRHGPLEPFIARCNPDLRGRILFYIFEGRRPRPTYVAKLGRTDYARRMLRRERDVYQDLRERIPAMRALRPRWYYDDGDMAFMLEPFVDGPQLIRTFGQPVHEQAAVDWLLDFHARQPARPLTKNDLLGFAWPLCNAARQEGCTQLADTLDRQLDRLTDFQVADVPVHGDFTSSNVLLAGGRVHVTDWEWVRPSGWPLEDISLYVIDAARLVEPEHQTETHNVRGAVRTLIGRTWYSPVVRTVLCGFAAREVLPATLVPIFLLLTIIQRATQHREEHANWRASRAGLYTRMLVELNHNLEPFWAYWSREDAPSLP